MLFAVRNTLIVNPPGRPYPLSEFVLTLLILGNDLDASGTKNGSIVRLLLFNGIFMNVLVRLDQLFEVVLGTSPHVGRKVCTFDFSLQFLPLG